MPNKGDFGGLKRGFLTRDWKEDKGKSSESSEKSGQLSTGDKQLVLMGVDPKKYHEKKLSDQKEAGGSSEQPERLTRAQLKSMDAQLNSLPVQEQR